MSTDGFEFNTSRSDAVQKYGHATNCDQNIATDIHDRANATDDIDIWVAPTAARKHNFKSTDAGDTSGGAGAKTIRFYGLRNWTTAKESYEDIIMDGTNNVSSVYSYVIIHRIKVLTFGGSGPNIGNITATTIGESVDYVTAQILAGDGQTNMAIYGVGGTQNAFITEYYISIHKGPSSPQASSTLLINPRPDLDETVFLVKHNNNATTVGARHDFNPYFKQSGPCIIKLQVSSTANDITISGGFGIILKDK